MLKLFICGQGYFGWAVYRSLLSLGHSVVGVAAPAGGADRLYNAAIQLDTPVIPGGTLTAETMPEGVDLIVCAHSYDFVGLKTLAKTTYGGVGYHPSLLPLHRGRDAIKWTIRMGDRVTGGSVYWLSKNVDGGPIAAQEWCFVPPGVTARDLWRGHLQPIGLRLIAKVVGDVSRGSIVAVPQDEAIATWEPSLDSQPIFRPDLERIGSPASQVTARLPRETYGLSGHWGSLAGGGA